MISGEQAKPLLITNVRPVAFGEHSDTTTDILVGKDGNISAIGKSLNAPAEVERIDGKGAWISPGWVDLLAKLDWRNAPRPGYDVAGPDLDPHDMLAIGCVAFENTVEINIFDIAQFRNPVAGDKAD